MAQNIYPVYQQEDPVYVSAFGIECNGVQAKWGLGRRTEGIVHYVISGRGWFNGHLVEENQGFYIEPNSFVEYHPDPDTPWNYFWMNCSPELARRYVFPTVSPDNNGIFDYDFRRKLVKILERLFLKEGPMSCVESLCYAFSILELHAPTPEPTKTQHYVTQAKNYIEGNLHRKLTVMDVADAISVHDRYLYSLFIRHEGLPPKEFILNRKVEVASDLLLNTNRSIMEIAVATGFPDVYSFSRLFKRKTGFSPSRFRKTVL